MIRFATEYAIINYKSSHYTLYDMNDCELDSTKSSTAYKSKTITMKRINANVVLPNLLCESHVRKLRAATG